VILGDASEIVKEEVINEAELLAGDISYIIKRGVII